MKKGLIVGALIVTIILGTFAVYADAAETQNIFQFGNHRNQSNRFLEDRGLRNSERCNFTEEERDEFLKERENFFKDKENLTPEEREEWFKERTEYKREAIKEALRNEKITEEQAQTLEKQLQEKEEYHKENGFSEETCNGQGFGMGLKDGIKKGHGRGMGRRNRL